MLRALRVILVLALPVGILAVGETVGAGTGLYRYVDERGVVHFTNAPSDRRYSRITVLRSLATRSRADHITRSAATTISSSSLRGATGFLRPW